MVKRRDGYHTLVTHVPDVLWNKLCAEGDSTGTSATRVLTQILARHYKVQPKELPKPKRAGRKPRGSG